MAPNDNNNNTKTDRPGRLEIVDFDKLDVAIIPRSSGGADLKIVRKDVPEGQPTSPFAAFKSGTMAGVFDEAGMNEAISRQARGAPPGTKFNVVYQMVYPDGTVGEVVSQSEVPIDPKWRREAAEPKQQEPKP